MLFSFIPNFAVLSFFTIMLLFKHEVEGFVAVYSAYELFIKWIVLLLLLLCLGSCERSNFELC